MFEKNKKPYTDLLGKTNRIVEGTAIKGNILSSADFRLDGQLLGDFQSKGKKLKLAAEGVQLNWELVDNASDALSGNWKIIGREQDAKIVPMKPGARKTIKILSGTRFQWIAINSETGDFFGTGGGNYSFSNGTHTENIEFFSRDSSRVGASLSFNAEIKNGDWHHSGLSSKGDRIYEIWSRK